MTYWEQRAIESIERMEASIKSRIPELIGSFENAKADLQKEIEAFWGRYAKNNAITLEDTQKALSLSELKNFKGRLKKYEKLARQSIGTFNLQVDNLSVKARITRLEALEAECDAVLQRLYQQQKTLIEDIATKVYTESYYHNLYDLERYTGFQSPFSLVPASAIEQVLKMPVQGADISTRLWRQDLDTGFRIRQTLNEMFAAGRPPQDFAEELQKAIGAIRYDEHGKVTGTGKKYEAYRLLYNESAQATNQADLRAYHDSGISYYKITATLDFKTSEKCRSLDGCVFDTKKGGDVPEKYRKTNSIYRQAAYEIHRVVTGVNYPPFHVNCRTKTTPFLPDLDGKFKDTRIARDENGKSVFVKDQTYEQWYQSKIGQLGREKVKVEEAKIQNESSDFRQYQRYKKILGNDAGKTFADFQNLKYNNIDKWSEIKKSVQQTSFLQDQLSYDWKGEQNFIPTHAIIKSVKTIAGKGADTPIRVVDRLAEEYGGAPESWTKKVGKVQSEKYIFDVHWYEKAGKQYEMKLKFRKDVK